MKYMNLGSFYKGGTFEIQVYEDVMLFLTRRLTEKVSPSLPLQEASP